VNFSALPTRLSSTCLSRAGSAQVQQHVVADIGRQRYALLAGDGLEQVDDVAHDRVQVEVEHLELQLLSLHLGQVQHVVEQDEQAVSARPDGLGVVTLPLGQLRAQQQGRSCP
jgi:hypothetical protein